MKKIVKSYRQLARTLLVPVLLTCAINSNAQRASVTADPQLGKISITDETGFAVNANDIHAETVIKLRIPVISDNHGNAIPAGSCKIKIGLGSKLVLDPAFNINNAELSNYFKWTTADNGGQVQITGDLINALPANVTAVDVSFKVKAGKEGSSTITANFLITNHSSVVVLSDENGNNNATYLPYKITGKIPVVAAGEATDLNLYPNPAKDVKSVVIEAKKGEFNGKYVIVMYDAAGKQVQTNTIELNSVDKFNYQVGNVAAGKYLLQITKSDASRAYTLKFEKL